MPFSAIGASISTIPRRDDRREREREKEKKRERENILTALRIPPLEPGVRAQGPVGVVELLARGEFLALGVDALVVIDVILPALD